MARYGANEDDDLFLFLGVLPLIQVRARTATVEPSGGSTVTALALCMAHNYALPSCDVAETNGIGGSGTDVHYGLRRGAGYPTAGSAVWWRRAFGRAGSTAKQCNCRCGGPQANTDPRSRGRPDGASGSAFQACEHSRREAQGHSQLTVGSDSGIGSPCQVWGAQGRERVHASHTDVCEHFHARRGWVRFLQQPDRGGRQRQRRNVW